MGWFLTWFPLKLAENDDVGETVIWCRWKCAWKKGIFCRTESVAMTPKSRDRMPAMSLWGVAAKWPTWAPKTKLILCLKDPQRIQPYQFEPARQDFERVPEHRVSFKAKLHAVFHGVCEIALTEVLTTQMGVMQCSKKVSLFELYKLNPLLPHCGSVARELVHCYTWGRLQIVAVRGNTVGRHS